MLHLHSEKSLLGFQHSFLSRLLICSEFSQLAHQLMVMGGHNNQWASGREWNRWERREPQVERENKFEFKWFFMVSLGEEKSLFSKLQFSAVNSAG